MAIVEEKQLKSMREYIKEIVIMGLVVAVVTLFKLYYNLNDFVIHTILEDKVKTELIIERNTDVIQALKSK